MPAMTPEQEARMELYIRSLPLKEQIEARAIALSLARAQSDMSIEQLRSLYDEYPTLRLGLEPLIQEHASIRTAQLSLLDPECTLTSQEFGEQRRAINARLEVLQDSFRAILKVLEAHSDG